LYDSIYQRLTTGRQAAYDQNLTLVNTKLQEVIDIISQSNQSQRRDEFYYLVYYNALSLKDHIPWPFEPKLTATPGYEKHALGEIHQIEATLVNQSNGSPISGACFTMRVVEGPNTGISQENYTNSQGKAIFRYTGYAEGTDKIKIGQGVVGKMHSVWSTCRKPFCRVGGICRFCDDAWTKSYGCKWRSKYNIEICCL